MKFLTIIAFAAGLTVAVPAFPSLDLPDFADLQARQTAGTVRNELLEMDGGSCPTAILIYARGSQTEGNMGVLGPLLADALENTYGDARIWVQGVGGAYRAYTHGIYLTRGTTQEAINEARELLELAVRKCPDSALVAGGYSQGSAVIAGAIEDGSPELRRAIDGVVLLGYTRNQENRGGIPGYAQNRLRVYCHAGDLLCQGMLIIRPEHLNYQDEAMNDAPAFLATRIGAPAFLPSRVV